MPYLRVAVAQIPDLGVDCGVDCDKLRAIVRRQRSPGTSRLVEKLDGAVNQLAGQLKSLQTELARFYLGAIFDFCNRRRVNVLVLPEYSVPLECLRVVRDLLRQHDKRIDLVVAGTHSFADVAANKRAYADCRLEPPPHTSGTFWVAPVFHFDGDELKGRLVPRRNRSPADPTPFEYLHEDWDPIVKFSARLDDGTAATINACVLTCIDAVREPHRPFSRTPHLFLVPAKTAHATISRHFEASFSSFCGRGAPTAFANGTDPVRVLDRNKKGGGSHVYSTVSGPPPEMTDDLNPLSSPVYHIPPGDAAVEIVDVFFSPNGSALGHHPSSWNDKDSRPTLKVTVAPIVSRDRLPQYCDFFEQVKSARDPPHGQDARDARDARDALSNPNAKLNLIQQFHQNDLRKLLPPDGAAGGVPTSLRRKVEEVAKAWDLPVLASSFAAKDDYERLVDVVVLRNPPAAVQSLQNLDDALLEFATKLRGSQRDEIVALRMEVRAAQMTLESIAPASAGPAVDDQAADVPDQIALLIQAEMASMTTQTVSFEQSRFQDLVESSRRLIIKLFTERRDRRKQADSETIQRLLEELIGRYLDAGQTSFIVKSSDFRAADAENRPAAGGGSEQRIKEQARRYVRRWVEESTRAPPEPGGSDAGGRIRFESSGIGEMLAIGPGEWLYELNADVGPIPRTVALWPRLSGELRRIIMYWSSLSFHQVTSGDPRRAEEGMEIAARIAFVLALLTYGDARARLRRLSPAERQEVDRQVRQRLDVLERSLRGVFDAILSRPGQEWGQWYLAVPLLQEFYELQLQLHILWWLRLFDPHPVEDPDDHRDKAFPGPIPPAGDGGGDTYDSDTGAR